jgi:hypothetical protein
MIRSPRAHAEIEAINRQAARVHVSPNDAAKGLHLQSAAPTFFARTLF